MCLAQALRVAVLWFRWIVWEGVFRHVCAWSCFSCSVLFSFFLFRTRQHPKTTIRHPRVTIRHPQNDQEKRILKRKKTNKKEKQEEKKWRDDLLSFDRLIIRYLFLFVIFLKKKILFNC